MNWAEEREEWAAALVELLTGIRDQRVRQQCQELLARPVQSDAEFTTWKAHVQQLAAELVAPVGTNGHRD